jgi:hypothetical protein
LLDATVVIAAFWFVLRIGLSVRAAVLAGAVYAFMPLAFRAFAYGILPTIFAQWLAVGTLMGLLLVTDERRGVMAWAGLALLAALAIIAFPTVAVFLTLIALAAAGLWWLTARRRYLEWGVLLLLAAAWALAIWAYYGIYISPVIASAQALLAPGGSGGNDSSGEGSVRWPGGFAELIAWTADYVVTMLPWLLAVAGLALVYFRLRGSASVPARRTFWMLVAWAGVAPLFMLVNYRMDMIGKHLFFTMLPVAVAAGIVLWELGRRRRWGMVLMALLVSTIVWQAMVFWVERLVRASS